MHIEWLKLYNFRNLTDGTFRFSPGLNLICGQNGQGKTNLIEAINLLSAGRSFRTQTVAEVVRWGEREGSVFALIKGALTDVELGVAVTSSGREAFVNGDKVSSLADFVGRLLCVTFSPTDLAIVKGAPQVRRKFLDRHLVDLEPTLMGFLLDYSRALKSKSAVLKRGDADATALEPWNVILARAAAPIMRARQTVLRALEERADEYYRTIARHDGRVTLSLETGFAGDDPSVDDIFAQLTAVAGRELRYKAAILGPHRDDFAIAIDGHDARAFASQGQSRSIVLALKLGVIGLLETQRHESPIVLLDDVDSELDQSRCDALFELVYQTKRQVFVTGTDRDRAARRRHGEAAEWEIARGVMAAPVGMGGDSDRPTTEI
jgi:DNA replication and repair protein RecF